MSQLLHPNVFDKGLEWAQSNTTRIAVLTGLPTDYADAITKLVGAANTEPSDFTLADGDLDPVDLGQVAPAGLRSRKITNQEKLGLVTKAGETVGNITAWLDDANEVVVMAGPATSQTFVYGNPLVVKPARIEILPSIPPPPE